MVRLRDFLSAALPRFRSSCSHCQRVYYYLRHYTCVYYYINRRHCISELTSTRCLVSLSLSHSLHYNGIRLSPRTYEIRP